MIDIIAFTNNPQFNPTISIITFKEFIMKTIKILIISLLLVTSQAFAWGKSEQKALLGFTAGVVLTHLVSNYDNNSYRSHATKTVYVQEPQRVVYVDRYQHYEHPRWQRHRHHEDKFACRSYDRRYDRHYDRDYDDRYAHHHRKHDRVVIDHYYH